MPTLKIRLKKGDNIKKRVIHVTELKYTFKTDTLFKLLFVRHPDLLKRLIALLLDIPLESISEFINQSGDTAGNP